MADVVVTNLHDRKSAAVRKTVLKKQRGRDAKGEVRMLYRLEASSGTFDVEFTKAFGLSVAKARKAQKDSNKRPDIVDRTG